MVVLGFLDGEETNLFHRRFILFRTSLAAFAGHGRVPGTVVGDCGGACWYPVNGRVYWVVVPNRIGPGGHPDLVTWMATAMGGGYPGRAAMGDVAAAPAYMLQGVEMGLGLVVLVGLRSWARFSFRP
ncbi:hypothetical protein RchiOBHm_Chr1g0373761 [Rosa chinensis]|uniref:Uncharacterized protein n=1 Tax=Rosa chinensis TaxID=74649 RepID=A0A2P6SM67_ROSCH|nr:hypothetical protein RchiOBHm_Chr1g0373761 [Rosa chinensis]